MNQDIPSFDTLLTIARSDPEQLEKIRRQLTARTINAAPKYLRPRLRGLQFRIDATRRLAGSPLAACVQISEMMYESLEELRQALNCLLREEATIREQRPKARVIPFPGNRSE